MHQEYQIILLNICQSVIPRFVCREKGDNCNTLVCVCVLFGFCLFSVCFSCFSCVFFFFFFCFCFFSGVTVFT